MIDDALWGFLDRPKLKCEKEMNDFYKRIIEEIKNA